jgi:hypothetical protein
MAVGMWRWRLCTLCALALVLSTGAVVNKRRDPVRCPMSAMPSRCERWLAQPVEELVAKADAGLTAKLLSLIPKEQTRLREPARPTLAWA